MIHFEELHKKADLAAQDQLRTAFTTLYIKTFTEEPYGEEIAPVAASQLFDRIFKSIFIGVFDEDELIGFGCALALKDTESPFTAYAEEHFPASLDNIFYLNELAIDYRYRGQGLGKQLLEKVLASLGQGRSVVLSTAQDDNNSIKLFYQNAGFTIVEGLTEQVTRKRINGSVNTINHIFMMKKTAHEGRGSTQPTK
jgi:ribosomal protein S18 acetylase RimI-like enzyme